MTEGFDEKNVYIDVCVCEYIYIYIYYELCLCVCMCVCLCVSVCVCVWMKRLCLGQFRDLLSIIFSQPTCLFSWVVPPRPDLFLPTGSQ